MRHVTFISVFVLFAFTMISCKRHKIEEIDYEYECHYSWTNDTEKDCAIKWFHDAGNGIGEVAESIEIKAGDSYEKTGWNDYNLLYSAKRISFSFAGESPFQVENPNHVDGIGGENWWNTLPKSSYELISDKPILEERKFYMSDVWDLTIAGQADRVYTEEELHVEIEWSYSGWSEVINETDGTVKLTTSYPASYHEDVSSVINAGDTVKLSAGAYLPGVSLEECEKATILFGDGTEVLCVPGAADAWSERFFGNRERRNDFEIVDFHGKKLRHDLLVTTYHIDNSLIGLWRDSNE